MRPLSRFAFLAVRILIATGSVAAIQPAAAQAATATAVVAVTALVLSNCIVVATPLAFGNYVQALLPATTTLTVTCTSGTTYNLGLDPGIGTGATVAVRKMSLLGNTLGYSIYSDAAHTVVFGNTIGTNTVTGTGTGLPQVITGYGLIPASEAVAPGAYVDTVTATVTY